MDRNPFRSAVGGAFFVAVSLVLVTGAEGAPRQRVLHSFDCATDGCGSYAGLIFDAKGNLYGTTLDSAFELAPGSGGWTLSVIHMFTLLSEGEDVFAGVTFDAAGNLYGTANSGGTYDEGTAWELKPAHGAWTLEVLQSFGNGHDGWAPWAGLVLDQAGNVYGTTQGNTVFKLTPPGGDWTETVIYNFTAKGDGSQPEAGLVWDATGNLYGTTRFGGAITKSCYGCGTVFELSPTANDGWKERVLYRFKWVAGRNDDGLAPYAGVILDRAGNLYGTTAGGGGDDRCEGGCGTVFKLTRLSSGRWKETILHSFHLDHNGYAPFAGVVLDKAGNVYGTTTWGGINNAGTVFKLSPGANGRWNYSVLHRFTGPDGAQSNAGLIFDKSGKHLYGTTSLGGAHNGGVVFEVTP